MRLKQIAGFGVAVLVAAVQADSPRAAGAGATLIDAIRKIDPDFGVLEARDFIRRRSGSSLAGEREFAFKHALTREVAYASLPKARRALAAL